MGNSFTSTAQDALDAGGGAESISPIDTTSPDDRQERSSALALRRAGSGGGEGRSALQAAQWSILSVG